MIDRQSAQANAEPMQMARRVEITPTYRDWVRSVHERQTEDVRRERGMRNKRGGY